MRKYTCNSKPCSSPNHYLYVTYDNRIIVKCKVCELISVFVFEKNIVEEEWTQERFKSILDFLGINQRELSTYLKTNTRTVRRWVSDIGGMPGSAIATLIAWEKLHKSGLNWRPDGIDLI